MLTDIETETRP
jgi:hypothetical protein